MCFGDVILMNPLKYLWYVFPACLRNTGMLGVLGQTAYCYRTGRKFRGGFNFAFFMGG